MPDAAKTDSYSITATGITAVNRSYVEVSKQEFGGGTSGEIPGAQISITSKDNKILGGVTVSGGATSVTASGSTISFTSGATSAIITGLPDGNYTMEEVVAPSDYVTLETTLDFTITNGVISSTNTDEHYTVTPASDGDGNLIVMKDDALPNAPLEILKLDENGDPLADAEFTLESKTIRDKIKSNESISGSEFYELRALSSVDISDLDEAFEANYLSELVTIDPDNESGGISMEITYGVKWKSSSESAFILSGLPDGEYILTEITPPNGYVPLDPLTFTIDKGNVQLPEGTNENIYAVDAPIV